MILDNRKARSSVDYLYLIAKSMGNLGYSEQLRIDYVHRGLSYDRVIFIVFEVIFDQHKYQHCLVWIYCKVIHIYCCIRPLTHSEI